MWAAQAGGRGTTAGGAVRKSSPWERWVAETESFCGQIRLERQDKAAANSAEPQRGEAEVKVTASKHRVFFP